MRDEVNVVLQIHLEKTGHDIQFKEEWIYDHVVACPTLSKEVQTKIILRGATRFEQAHAIIETPDGKRYMQLLGPRVPQGISDERLQYWTWAVSIGKPKLLLQCV